MIAYLEGKLTFKSPTTVFLDVGGLAYEVQISLHTYSQVEVLAEAKLYTKLIIRETDHSMYGFFTMEEKDLFIKLLSVKGIGPNTARVILSYMTPDEVRSAILHDNTAAFKKVKGVGPKSAQQIILDLKGKITKESLSDGTPGIQKIVPSSIREEAMAALQALGFQRSQVAKRVGKILSEQPDINQVESLIKTVLKQL